MNGFSLEGKAALVTGGGRGLGRGIALALAEAGADVAVASRTKSQVDKVVQEIEALGRRAFAVVADVTQPDSVGAMVGAVADHFGRFDILVNAAGVNKRVPSLDLTPNLWDQIVDTNLKGTFFSCQAAARVMKEQGGGKIINVASLATVFGLPMRTPYTAAKSGVAGLTRALAVEWAPYNIRVNAIAPGYFRTEMTEPLFSDPEWTRRLLERIPMQRTGVPEDLAGTAVFLASQASDYVTGQVIYVDGGYSAGWPDRPVFDQYKERLTKQNLRDKMSAAIGMVEEDVVSRGDLSSLEASGAIGIIRIRAGEDLVRIAQALREGGLSCLEITMNTPGALRAIEEASANLEGVTMGAGTVLDAVTARQAILAGAQFLVTPTVKLDVLEMAHRYGVPAIIGAMTPTEILTAWEAGADMVKIFPACILGPKFIQEVHGPLPQIPLVPTGGITADNAPDFIRAGAALVCVGGWLVDKRAVAEGRYEVLTENARRLVAAVRKARNP